MNKPNINSPSPLGKIDSPFVAWIKKNIKAMSTLDRRKAYKGWLFVLPFVIGILVIYVPVIYDSIKFTFVDIHEHYDVGTFTITPAGFSHYRYALFEDTSFVKKLLAGLQQMVFDIPAIIVFSLFVAVILNQKMIGRAAFRAIFFIPVIISTGIMETVASKGQSMMEYMEGEGGIDTGSGTSASATIVSAIDVEMLLSGMKIGQGLVTYVASAVSAIYEIVNRSGVQMLIFLAGLQSISPAIYEACRIDGATPWETFWKITFPMISPMILVNLIYTVIDSFTTKKNVVMEYISKQGVSGSSQATAMAWIYFLIIMLIVSAFVAIASAFIFYQRRD